MPSWLSSRSASSADVVRALRCRSSLAEFEKLGGISGRSPADVGAQTQIVFSCLPSSEALEEVVQLASREMALEQELRMLGATNKLFRYWHVAHRPFAIMAAFATIVHLFVVITLGQTWFH